MAKKRKEDDAVADFFGDSDIDWFEEDDDDDGGDSVAGDRERLPVAPPPPPPFAGEGKTATPLEEAETKPEKPLASAPTLIFSSVPTTPIEETAPEPKAAPPEPEPEPEPEPKAAPPEPAAIAVPSPPVEEAAPAPPPEAPAPAPPPAAEHIPLAPEPTDSSHALEANPPVADIPTSEQPTVEIELPKLEPRAVPEQDTIPTQLAPNELDDVATEVFGDDLDAQVAEETPLVRSLEPAPERASAPAAATPPPAEKAPDGEYAAAKTMPPGSLDEPTVDASAWQPAEGADAWRAVSDILTREAAAASGDDAVGLLLERAAEVLERHVRDADGAVSLYTQARAVGRSTPGLLRGQADALGRMGKFEEQATVLSELGAQLEGEARASTLLEAGLVAWRRLNKPAEAVSYLRAAAEADANDYTSRALLRALLPSVGTTDPSERATLLAELAGIAEGGIAADAHIEAAEAADEGGDAAGVRQHLQAALVAEPAHAGAFLRLERVLAEDLPALAAMYETEAARPGQTDPGWWRAEAARAWHVAGRGDQAVAGFGAAIEAGFPSAIRELQGGWVRAGAWTELEAALVREAESLDAENGSAFAWYRLGWLREHRLSDDFGAVEAYKATVAADPSAVPATDAMERLLSNNQEDRKAFLQSRLDAAPEPAERVGLLLGLGESAETEGDHSTSRTHYEAVLAEVDAGPARRVAADGLDRALQRLADVPALSAHRKARAEAAEGQERADWHFLACVPPFDAFAAVDGLRATLDARPDHPGALSTLALALEVSGSWGELGERLQAAGDASESAEIGAAYAYRAARVFADLAGDADRATACVQAALTLDAGFRAARTLQRALGGQGDGGSLAGEYRAEAGRAADPVSRNWARFAAAVADSGTSEARADLDAILAEKADHPGALAALEVQLVADADHAALVELYLKAADGDTSPAGARLAARAAALLATAGEGQRALEILEKVADMGAEAPQRPAARLALRLGARDLALRILEGLDTPEDHAERARLLGQAGRPAEALPLLRSLLETGPDPVGAAARTATVAQQVGDADAMLEAYVTIARRAHGAPLAAAYGAWTGMQLQGSGNDAESLEFWRIALEARPGSAAASNGVVRALSATGDVAGIREVLADAAPEQLADALAVAGDPGAAAEVMASAGNVEGDPPARLLAALVVLEHFHGLAGGWQQAYDALSGRRDLCSDSGVQADADAKRRWILAEHLAESDAAWELYKALHDDAPGDTEVTEALARIAGARGEVALAIGYLKELADAASSPEDAARFQRRVGEVYERADQGAAAKQAYLDALDHLPADGEALDGLKRLATAEEDWPALAAVLERESGIASGDRAADVRREVALLTEDKLGDPAVAMDKWRALTELVPDDREALEHLLELSHELGEWGVYVETGEALAGVFEGTERSELLRKVGIACHDRLGRDDAHRYFEQAVQGDPPDLEAALRLEQLARGRADWGGAIDALSLQAHESNPEEQRIKSLISAARIEIEARHDREAGAAFYAKVLEIRDDHEASLRFMAAHLFETGRFDEALPVCERLEPMVEEGQDLEDFDTRMELSSFHFYYAEMLRLQNREEQAIPRYERALELNPTHLPSLEAVGPLYTEHEEWQKAERVYRQLLQLSGGQGDRQKVATMYTALGLVERKLDNMDKAYKRFNKALELHANHVGALKGMALILEDRGDWSNLLNVYNNIIYHATVPEDVIDAYMTKGRILDAQMQRQDKAAQHFQRSLDFDQNQPSAYLRLAELAMRRDEYTEAGKLAEKALQLDQDLVQPIRPLLLLVRAAALHHEGHPSDAERCVREAGMIDRNLGAALGETPLADLEVLRQVIKDQLP